VPRASKRLKAKDRDEAINLEGITPVIANPDALHPEDTFHAPPDDPWAFESFWFSFFIPEKRVMVYVYPWFRPTLGIAGGGVIAWDNRASVAWNLLHCDYSFQLPCPNLQALVHGNKLHLPHGIIIQVLEPLKTYALSYDHPNLSLHVTFTAIHPANIATRPIGGSQLFAGRIDQCGRVVGEAVIEGEEYAIDCLSMRDRSWGTRRDDNKDMNIGYYHATLSDRDAFLVVANHAVSEIGASNDENAPIATGYLMEDGVLRPITEGTATLGRNSQCTPIDCAIQATDAAGRKLRASGSAINWFAFQPYPGMFNWSSLANWQFNSRVCVGELQNTWHPDRWRAFYRRHLSL
jgi:hypothetical protein